jgi:hypothetical protein
MGSTRFDANARSRRGQANLRENLSVVFQQAKVLGRAAGEVAALSGQMRGGSMRDTLDSLGLGGLPMPSLARARACRGPDCCDCPPTDLGCIRRTLDRPEHAEVLVRLRNPTGRKRTYLLEMSNLDAETGDGESKAAVVPAAVDLDPGETAVVSVQVEAAEQQPGVDYEGVLRIRAENCDDLRLCICVRVDVPKDCAPLVDLHCCCHPKVRPLRWYHHYYCDPPVGQTRDDRPEPNRPPG